MIYLDGYKIEIEFIPSLGVQSMHDYIDRRKMEKVRMFNWNIVWIGGKNLMISGWVCIHWLWVQQDRTVEDFDYVFWLQLSLSILLFDWNAEFQRSHLLYCDASSELHWTLLFMSLPQDSTSPLPSPVWKPPNPRFLKVNTNVVFF